MSSLKTRLILTLLLLLSAGGVAWAMMSLYYPIAMNSVRVMDLPLSTIALIVVICVLLVLHLFKILSLFLGRGVHLFSTILLLLVTSGVLIYTTSEIGWQWGKDASQWDPTLTTFNLRNVLSHPLNLIRDVLPALSGVFILLKRGTFQQHHSSHMPSVKTLGLIALAALSPFLSFLGSDYLFDLNTDHNYAQIELGADFHVLKPETLPFGLTIFNDYFEGDNLWGFGDMVSVTIASPSSFTDSFVVIGQKKVDESFVLTDAIYDALGSKAELVPLATEVLEYSQGYVVHSGKAKDIDYVIYVNRDVLVVIAGLHQPPEILIDIAASLK